MNFYKINSAIFKRLYLYFSYRAGIIQYRNKIKKLIFNLNCKQLTKAQVKEIKVYYASCGYRNINTNWHRLYTHTSGNFYKEYIKPDASDKQTLWMGRYSGIGLTFLGVLFALYIDNVLHAFLFIETIAAFMGIMVFGGNLWKRANRYGALTSIIVSFGLYYYLNFLDMGTWELVYKWKPEIFGWAMLAGFAVFIVVTVMY